METWEIIALIAVPASLLAIWLIYQNFNSLDHIWRKFARSRKLRYFPGNNRAAPRIIGSYGKTPIEITVESYEKDRSIGICTRFSAYFSVSPPSGMNVASLQYEDVFGAHFGGTEISVEDDALEGAYTFHGHDEESIARLLTVERSKQALMRFVSDHRRCAITAHRSVFVIPEAVRNAETLMKGLDDVTAVVKELEHVLMEEKPKAEDKADKDQKSEKIKTDDKETKDKKADKVKTDDKEAKDQKADKVKADDKETKDQKADKVKADDKETKDQKADKVKTDDKEAKDQKADKVKTESKTTSEKKGQERIIRKIPDLPELIVRTKAENKKDEAIPVERRPSGLSGLENKKTTDPPKKEKPEQQKAVNQNNEDLSVSTGIPEKKKGDPVSMEEMAHVWSKDIGPVDRRAIIKKLSKGTVTCTVEVEEITWTTGVELRSDIMMGRTVIGIMGEDQWVAVRFSKNRSDAIKKHKPGEKIPVQGKIVDWDDVKSRIILEVR